LQRRSFRIDRDRARLGRGGDVFLELFKAPNGFIAFGVEFLSTRLGGARGGEMAGPRGDDGL
jgi:hypothetical protein